MRNLKLSLLTILLLISCSGPTTDCRKAIGAMRKELAAGNLRIVHHLADSLKKSCNGNRQVMQVSDSLDQIAGRIALDFSLSGDQIIARIKSSTGSYSESDRENWEKRGWLEGRLINGEKMYFNRAVSNLLLLKKFYEQKEIRQRETAEDPEMTFRLKHTEEAFKLSGEKSPPVVPVRMGITYTITVHPGVVPEGETVRCWMPWPKSGHARQTGVELLNTSCTEYKISPDSSIHSAIYMEQKVKKGVPTVFRVSFRYQSGAQYFNISGLKILPYDKASDNYRKYTCEQLPQINFAEEIRNLADSITGKEESPEAIVRKIYSWFKENIPWTGAPEYSIMPDIPHYVCQNHRGDCGMQTFLFISMLRYKGIPVRWQSGWMVPPGAENLHDWCEVYYEGPGWIPVDVSYDLQNSGKKEVKEFYMSGIDSYRLIVNDGVAGTLYPHKQFMRSEPYDFQRGEVEWKGGNLYFDKWDYSMKIDYLN
jgi:Transglutaminase-like superfamily